MTIADEWHCHSTAIALAVPAASMRQWHSHDFANGKSMHTNSYSKKDGKEETDQGRYLPLSTSGPPKLATANREGRDAMPREIPEAAL